MHETIHNSKITIIISFFIVIINLNSGCSDNAPIPIEQPINFGIYLLEDKYLKRADIVGKDINELKLQSKPIISDKDIDFYDYSSHFIYLKKSKDEIFPEYKDLFPDKQWHEKPFVICVKEEKCYWGFFGGLGWEGSEPMIHALNIRSYPKDMLRFEYYNYYFRKDQRNSEKLKAYLIESKKYSAGIEIEIDSLRIFINETSIIEFNLIIKNNDRDNLYVIDPYKAEPPNYYFYTDGIRMRKIGETYNYKLTYRNLISPGANFKNSYLTKVESGSNINRKLRLMSPEKPTFGNYYCQIEFENPHSELEKEKRILNDGRIWLGPVMSNILDITFDKNNNCRINNKNVIFE